MTTKRTPTDSELAILEVLWRRGASTVREVQAGLPEGRDMGYTTALKLLQIMHVRGLVLRDESRRAHIYSALAPKEKTQRNLVQNLLKKGFAGSSHDLVMRVLESNPCSPEELKKIRALLQQFDDGDTE